MAISVDTYTGHTWVDNSTPDLEAEVLNEIEEGIRKNNTAIKAVLNALVSQITNDPDKFASMAALYAVNQNLGALNTAVTNINSNLGNKADKSDLNVKAGLSTINNFTESNVFTKSVGVGGDSYKTSGITLRVNYLANNSVRAQIGFENQGSNAGILWLDTDGKLKFTDNFGNYHTINWT